MHASTVRQILVSFIITMSILMSGTFFGWPSPVAQIFRTQNTPVNMTPNQESWMVACIEIGNLLLPLPAGVLMNAIGRRLCLMTSVPLALAGWALVRFTRDVWCLYAARILQGCAMAVAYTVVPVYLGEIAGVDIRGSLSLFFQGMSSSGILLVYVVGWAVSYDTLAVAMSTVPILLATLLLMIPESPHYLVMKNDEKAAIKSLKWLRPSDSSAQLKEEMRSMATSKSSSGVRALFTKTGRPLFIVTVIGTCQIFCGVVALEAYASTAFEKDESMMAINADACAVILGLTALVGVLVSAATVDRHGRRPLLLASSAGCAVSQAAAAYGLYYGDHGMLILFALAAAVFFANAGLMPLVTTIVCEYFPTHNRALANCITQFIMTAASLVSLKIYQPITVSCGLFVNYVLFAAVAVFSTAFVYLLVPETKGKTFKEIELMFGVVEEPPAIAKKSSAVDLT